MMAARLRSSPPYSQSALNLSSDHLDPHNEGLSPAAMGPVIFIGLPTVSWPASKYFMRHVNNQVSLGKSRQLIQNLCLAIYLASLH